MGIPAINYRLHKFSYIFFIVVAFSLLTLAISSTANAAPAGWNAGRIMDNGVFANKDSMNAAGIQAFLNSKVPVCDTYGSQPSEYGGGTRAQWAQSRYGQSTFVCLKDASEGGKSAAQIIYDTAQKYQINPQVLIVLLQKEQGLVTDTWPINVQYRTATGYGCPDTAPCDSQYYGLTNQLDWSAKMFRAIMNASPTWYTPYVLGNNFIRYSPDSACGGSNVTIQNRATQALYNYTPYQPNQAALDADWGTVPCGAYGNRNFYLYFTSWFGSTFDPTYAWVNEGVSVYTNSNRSNVADLSKVNSGDRLYVTVKARNTGNVTWRNTGENQIKLGTWGPQDRQSSHCDASWYGCNRPALLREPSVPPGQIGSFEFWINVPSDNTPGWKFEGFNPVAENASWFNGDGFTASFTVVPTYSANVISKDSYFDASKTNSYNTAKLTPGQKVLMSIKVQNTGNITWVNSGNNPVRLGTWAPQDSKGVFCDDTWISCTRATTLAEASVAPGQVGTFEFWAKSPTSTGLHTAYYNLLTEGSTWFRNSSFYTNSIVSSPSYKWQATYLQAFSDSNRTVPIALQNGNLMLEPGQKAYVRLNARNIGNTAWKNSGGEVAKLGTWNSRDHTSPMCDPSWESCNRPATLKEPLVLPDQIGTFEFILNGPTYRGNHLEFYNMLIEGKAWLNDGNLFYRVIN